MLLEPNRECYCETMSKREHIVPLFGLACENVTDRMQIT